MYKPKKNSLVSRFFSWYISFIIGKDFNSFKFNEIDVPVNTSILLLANHFSWWDGFFLYHINKKHFKKKFHVLINEDNYLKVGFLKYLGGFAAKSGGKDVIETLEFASSLLEDPENFVLFFPQGKLESNHINTISFQKGVSRILKTGKVNVSIVFAATFIDYFENRKPTAFTYLAKHNTETYESLQVLKNAYNNHYKSSVKKQSEIII